MHKEHAEDHIGTLKTYVTCSTKFATLLFAIIYVNQIHKALNRMTESCLRKMEVNLAAVHALEIIAMTMMDRYPQAVRRCLTQLAGKYYVTFL